jgi:hypothetical protein
MSDMDPIQPIQTTPSQIFFFNLQEEKPYS